MIREYFALQSDYRTITPVGVHTATFRTGHFHIIFLFLSCTRVQVRSQLCSESVDVLYLLIIHVMLAELQALRRYTLALFVWSSSLDDCPRVVQKKMHKV